MGELEAKREGHLHRHCEIAQYSLVGPGQQGGSEGRRTHSVL